MNKTIKNGRSKQNSLLKTNRFKNINFAAGGLPDRRKKILKNAIAVFVIAVLLSVYFSVKGIWGIAQAVIILILALTAGRHFFIYFRFFRDKNDNNNKKTKKSLDNNKNL